MMSASASAQIAGAEFLQSAVDVGLQHILHRQKAGCIKNTDAHLMHGVQRTHSHASGNEHTDASVRQSLYGNNTAAMLMPLIVFDADIKNPTVLNTGHRIGVTVAEMSAGNGLKTGGSIGRNSNKDRFRHDETPLI